MNDEPAQKSDDRSASVLERLVSRRTRDAAWIFLCMIFGINFALQGEYGTAFMWIPLVLFSGALSIAEDTYDICTQLIDTLIEERDRLRKDC